MIIVFWNCQGIGNRETFRALKFLISTTRLDVLILLEPRISGSKADEVCRKLNFDDWARVECVGYSGGIWLLWNSSNFSIDIVQTSPQFIHCRMEEKNREAWFLTAVYGSPNVGARNLLWQDLRVFGSHMAAP